MNKCEIIMSSSPDSNSGQTKPVCFPGQSRFLPCKFLFKHISLLSLRIISEGNVSGGCLNKLYVVQLRIV